MPAREELSAGNNAFVILDATHTLSPVRPESESDVIPIQQSLDLGAARMDTSLAKRSALRLERRGSTSLSLWLVSAKRSRARGEDGTPVAENPQCESGLGSEEQPGSLSSATSVRHIPASPLSSSANDTARGTALPSRAPGRADVPLAERVALSVEEAGALLGISRDLAYDLVARARAAVRPARSAAGGPPPRPRGSAGPALGRGIEIGHSLPHCNCRFSVSGVEEVSVGPERDARVGVAKAAGNRAYTHSLSSQCGSGEMAKSVERHVREIELVSQPDECPAHPVGTVRPGGVKLLGPDVRGRSKGSAGSQCPLFHQLQVLAEHVHRRGIERDPARLVGLGVLLSDDLASIGNGTRDRQSRQVHVEVAPRKPHSSPRRAPVVAAT